jgi:hypothetical protein
VDERARAFSTSSCPRDWPSTWGTNIIAFPLGEVPPAFAAKYHAIAQMCRDTLPFCYVYPIEYLHVTVTPPAPFTRTTIPPHERLRHESEWSQAIQQMLLRSPVTTFSLFYHSMRLDSTAGIFLLSDPSNAMSRFRSDLSELSSSLPHWGPIQAPNIIHTTFLRYKETPSLPMDEIQRRFQMIQSLWTEDIEVRIDRFIFIREVVPYLHQDASAHVIAEYPLIPIDDSL